MRDRFLFSEKQQIVSSHKQESEDIKSTKKGDVVFELWIYFKLVSN